MFIFNMYQEPIMKSSYDRYYIFYHVAKYKSFTKAAKALLSNQPNVTHAMNRLEQELGCRLFIRSHRGICLTPEGETLYRRAAIAFEQLTLAEDELSLATGLHTGSVTIGASETALHGFLLLHLRDFCSRYPGIHIRILNDSTNNAVSAVRSGKVDFSLAATPTGVSSPLTEICLCRFQDILLAGRKYAYLADKPRHLADLAGIPLICMIEESKTFEFYNQFYYQNGLSLKPDIEVATSDLVVPMVKSDLAIGFLPSFYAAECIRQKECVRVPLLEQLPERSICLIQDSGRSLNVAARELRKFLLEKAG